MLSFHSLHNSKNRSRRFPLARNGCPVWNHVSRLHLEDLPRDLQRWNRISVPSLHDFARSKRMQPSASNVSGSARSWPLLEQTNGSTAARSHGPGSSDHNRNTRRKLIFSQPQTMKMLEVLSCCTSCVNFSMLACLLDSMSSSQPSSRRRLKELKTKNRMSCLWSKGTFGQCAMSSSSSSTQNQTRTARLATRQQLASQPNQFGVCFVLNEYSDDLDTASAAVSRTHPLSTIAPRTTTTNHGRPKSITGQAGTKRSRAERIVVCCMDLFCATIQNKLYHWTKQRPSPQTCVSFSPWHTDVIASTCRPGGMPASAATCPGGCKEFSLKGSNAHSIRLTCKICGTVRKEERHPQRQDPATCSHRHTDHRGEQRTHAKDVLC